MHRTALREPISEQVVVGPAELLSSGHKESQEGDRVRDTARWATDTPTVTRRLSPEKREEKKQENTLESEKERKEMPCESAAGQET